MTEIPQNRGAGELFFIPLLFQIVVRNFIVLWNCHQRLFLISQPSNLMLQFRNPISQLRDEFHLLFNVILESKIRVNGIFFPHLPFLSHELPCLLKSHLQLRCPLSNLFHPVQLLRVALHHSSHTRLPTLLKIALLRPLLRPLRPTRARRPLLNTLGPTLLSWLNCTSVEHFPFFSFDPLFIIGCVLHSELPSYSKIISQAAEKWKVSAGIILFPKAVSAF